MKRAKGTAAGLRQLLIADREQSRKRWPSSSDEWLDDLRARKAVVVSSAQVMCALSHAGLPHGDYAFGGSEWHKVFVLDERDQLTEYTG